MLGACAKTMVTFLAENRCQGPNQGGRCDQTGGYAASAEASPWPWRRGKENYLAPDMPHPRAPPPSRCTALAHPVDPPGGGEEAAHPSIPCEVVGHEEWGLIEAAMQTALVASRAGCSLPFRPRQARTSLAGRVEQLMMSVAGGKVVQASQPGWQPRGKVGRVRAKGV